MNNIKNFREKSLALTNDKAQSETYLRYNAEEASASKSPKQAGISLRQYIAALARSYKSIILWSLLLALLGLGAALLQHNY